MSEAERNETGEGTITASQECLHVRAFAIKSWKAWAVAPKRREDRAVASVGHINVASTDASELHR